MNTVKLLGNRLIFLGSFFQDLLGEIRAVTTASYFSYGSKTLASAVPGPREAQGLQSGWEQGQPSPTGRQDSVPRAPVASSLPALLSPRSHPCSTRHSPALCIAILPCSSCKLWPLPAFCLCSDLPHFSGEAPGTLNAAPPSPTALQDSGLREAPGLPLRGHHCPICPHT